MAKKSYSDAEKDAALAALAANAGNLHLTAAQLQIPRKTLERWAKKVAGGGADAPAKKDLAAKLDEIAHKLADAIPGKIGAAGLQPTSVSLGITIEKARLLREQPTSITGQGLPIDLKKLSDEQLTQLHAILVAAGLPLPA